MSITGNRYAGRKELTRVGGVLYGNPGRNRLHALKARRRLEIGALLAAMQARAALRTWARKICARGQRR